MLGGTSEQVELFYREHNGLLLYKDSMSDAAGIELFPALDWNHQTTQMREYWQYLSGEDDPDHIAQGVAIGEVPQSGNYFAIPISGPSIGKVFYANHDGWYEAPFAECFNDFLARLTQTPAKLLAEDLGCYTRYNDGQTGIQWIPNEYVADARTVATV